jgi:hypothetical protein
MATHLKILSQYDIKSFECPPEFNGDERKRFFYLSKWANDLVKSFRTPRLPKAFANHLKKKGPADSGQRAACAQRLSAVSLLGTHDILKNA